MVCRCLLGFKYEGLKNFKTLFHFKKNYFMRCFFYDLTVFLFYLSGNGFIEGTELDGFLREFVSSANPTEVNAEVCVASIFKFITFCNNLSQRNQVSLITLKQ